MIAEMRFEDVGSHFCSLDAMDIIEHKTYSEKGVGRMFIFFNRTINGLPLGAFFGFAGTPAQGFHNKVHVAVKGLRFC